MVPKLRFKEFDDCWAQCNIQDLVNDSVIDKPMDGNHGELHPVSVDYVDNGIPFIMASDIIDGKIDFIGCKKISLEQANSLRKGFSLTGDILLTHKATIGNVAIVPELTSPFIMLTPQVTYYRVKNNKKLLNRYIKFFFETPTFIKELTNLCSGATRPYIGISEQRKLPFRYSSIEEQTKIADFLSSADEKITSLNKQYDLLSQYKKGMMQKIFSQEVRFKDENGEEFPEWNSCQLKDVATRVTRKNKENNQTILTISGRDGLVDQMSYFNKQIASKNVAGYYLINNGEFAYNKSYSQGYPMGAIKMLTNYDRGVVSTLCICFKLNANQSNSFYQHYFESGLQNRSIEKVAQEGARNHGLLNIGVNDFFDIELQIPSLKEQIKIADYLSALDDKIAVKKAELDKLKTWKQGLLQQMFV